ncbi:MAG: hypothetical protein HWQ38_01010 [Nostoc sp. NMS7]|nr:hypothetical protein [Nostoc sp. NMS7]MBN3945135.1 hypothetical protein [Nostoc sp. NMS7]
MVKKLLVFFQVQISRITESIGLILYDVAYDVAKLSIPDITAHSLQRF